MNYSFGLIFLLLLIITVLPANAQPGWNLKENSVWSFGWNNGLDFNSGAPVAITTSSDSIIGGRQTTTAVSDHNGHLLFYTDSDSLFNRNHHKMPNGTIGSLSPLPSGNGVPNAFGSSSWNAQQGTLILPVLDNPDRYYVFCLNGYADLCAGVLIWNWRLVYSVVDMKLDNGLGDVVPGLKSIPVDSSLFAGMTAVGGNNCNTWLIVHDKESATFRAYEITEAGISATPVTSMPGGFSAIYNGTIEGAYKLGEMIVSPGREKLAIATGPFGEAGAELFDFDVNTGIVSNRVAVDSGYDWFGCFSPDGSKLYLTDLVNENVIKQFDLSLPTAAAIMNSKYIVADSVFKEGSNIVGQMWLGLNGKIYFSEDTGVYFSCIQNPNLAGVACNYTTHAVQTLHRQSGLTGSYGFVKPQMLDSVYTKKDTVFCTATMDSMQLKTSGSFWYEWDNGSTDSVRTITQPGTYWVWHYTYCHYRVDTFVVSAIDLSFNLGNDTVICHDPPFQLSVPASDVSYQWSDVSDISNSYIITASGKYWLRISKDVCVNSDTVNVLFMNLAQDLGKDYVFCKGDSLNIPLKANAPGDSRVLWSTGDTTTQYTVKNQGKYWVTVSYTHCIGTDTMNVSIDPFCECVVNMPDAFSPNADGKNDVFGPVIEPQCPVKRYELHIYNRWGQTVFISFSMSKGWDGTFNGVPADVGTYMYDLEFEGGTKSKKYHRKGDILLVR